MLRHILNDALHRDIDGVFDYAFIQVTDNVLDDAELLEQFAPRVEHFVGENILLAIDPKVRETFLS